MADKYVLSGEIVSIFGKSDNLKRTLTLVQLGQEDWQGYRKLTGECETCGQAMKAHTQCKSCKILIGQGHLEDYDNNGECGWCIRNPRVFDVKAKRKGLRNATT